MLRKIVDFVKKIFWTEPMISTVNTLKDAMRELEVARNHFENCDPEFITAAIFELNAAESRLDAARRCAGGRRFIIRLTSADFARGNLTMGIPIVISKMRRTIWPV